MLVKVETVFAGEVGRERLPSPPSVSAGHPFAGRQWRESALHCKTGCHLREEIVTVVASPDFGKNEYVRVQRRHVVDHSSWSTPTVDSRVKVKRRDTHHETLRRRRASVAVS
jgi:hypothetical protein